MTLEIDEGNDSKKMLQLATSTKISQEKPYCEFIETLKSPESKLTYSKILLKFMKTHKFKSTQGMLPPNISSIDKIEEMIKDHLLALRKDKVSYNHVNTNFCVLKHFYLMNNVRINKEKLARYVGEFELKYDLRAYQTEEIRSILAHSDLRMKVVVHTMAATGMRIGALVKLKLKDIEKKSIQKDGLVEVYQFTVYKNTREHSVCFCHPECTALIDSYLDYRKRAGEKLAQDDPFIREQFDQNDRWQVEHPKQVSVSTLSNILQAVLVKAGIKKINHDFTGRERHSVPLNHGFRYWWMEEAMRARMNPEIRERLFSHDTGNLKRRYWKNQGAEPELLDEYIRCVNNGAFAISKEYTLQRKIEVLEPKRTEIETMQDQIKALWKQLKFEREQADQKVISTFKMKDIDKELED